GEAQASSRKEKGENCLRLTHQSAISVAAIKRKKPQSPPGRAGVSAFALLSEKSGGTSNLPVCRSYLQRQSFTTPVCWGLRLLMSASPERPMRRYRFSGQSTPSQR